MARVFAEATKRKLYVPEHSLVFIATASEEIGLLGSIYYAIQHEPELQSITAAINLDCIGSDILAIGQTMSIDGLDVDEIMLTAASDLNVEALLTEGAGEAEVFRNSDWADYIHYVFWGTYSGLSNATRLETATALSSVPVLYVSLWIEGRPGWIHTEYDNSTTLNWIEVKNLENHIKVAAVSVMRILSHFYVSFPWHVAGITIGVTAVAVILIYFERSRVHMFLKAVYESGRDVALSMGYRGFVNVAVLTVVFLLISILANVHYGRIETNVKGCPTMIPYVYYGFPLRLAGMMQAKVVPLGDVGDTEAAPSMVEQIQGGSFVIFWDGLILDVLSDAVLAFVAVYVSYKFKYWREFRRSSQILKT